MHFLMTENGGEKILVRDSGERQETVLVQRLLDEMEYQVYRLWKGHKI